MKHFRLFLPLLVLTLLLSGCAKEPMPYTYTSGDRTVTVDPITRTIMDKNEVFTYVVVDMGAAKRYEITFPDGSIYYWTDSGNSGSGGWTDNFDTERWFYANFLVDALKQSAPRQKTGNVVVGLFLMGLGALNLFLPQVSVHVKYGWRFRNAEPSDAYLAMIRFGGALIGILGLIWCIV